MIFWRGIGGTGATGFVPSTWIGFAGTYPSGVGRSSGADWDHRRFDVPVEVW
jgi:hypothetical protein